MSRPLPSGPHRAGTLFQPSMRVPGVLAIDLDDLAARGIRGLVCDLDDTLVHARAAHAEPEIRAWITEASARFKVAIVSNNRSHERVRVAADHLELPFHARALKPSRRFLRKAMEDLGLTPAETAIVGDQLFTDVVGGNRLGAFTILVDPLGPERRWHRKVMRAIEKRFVPPHASRPALPHSPTR